MNVRCARVSGEFLKLNRKMVIILAKAARLKWAEFIIVDISWYESIVVVKFKMGAKIG